MPEKGGVEMWGRKSVRDLAGDDRRGSGHREGDFFQDSMHEDGIELLQTFLSSISLRLNSMRATFRFDSLRQTEDHK